MLKYLNDPNAALQVYAIKFVFILLKWSIYTLRLDYRANLCLKKLAENKIGSPNYKKMSLRKTV